MLMQYVPWQVYIFDFNKLTSQRQMELIEKSKIYHIWYHFSISRIKIFPLNKNQIGSQTMREREREG
jgi:hypothetical protein